MNPLTRTWVLLIGLSVGTVLLAPLPGMAAMAGLLILAWFKARAILGGFLHLRTAPDWLSVLTVPLALWMLGMWGLSALTFR